MNSEHLCKTCAVALTKKPGPGRWPHQCAECKKLVEHFCETCGMSLARRSGSRGGARPTRFCDEHRPSVVRVSPERLHAARSESAKKRWDKWRETHEPTAKAPRSTHPCRYCGAQCGTTRAIQCGAPECQRKHNTARAHRYPSICRACGKDFLGTRKDVSYCSTECGPTDIRRAKRFKHKAIRFADRAARGTHGSMRWAVSVDGTIAPARYANTGERGALRVAYEQGDTETLLALLLARTTVTVTGCMEWPVLGQDGYPRIKIAKVTMAVHRLVTEAVHGPLGRQAAHHTCANPPCINPAHLQPVSQRENTAEMLQRNYYIKRINDLEIALTALAPSHKLIAHTLTAA